MKWRLNLCAPKDTESDRSGRAAKQVIRCNEKVNAGKKEGVNRRG